MISVYSVLWGDKYPPDYVYRLKRGIERNLRESRFFCVTEQRLEGITTLKPPCEYPGWWQKLGLFKRHFAMPGPCLYVDLDSVIVGPLDDLVERFDGCDLAMTRNWARSGFGGWQSSLMIWNGSDATAELYDNFDWQRDHDRLWGDQEWIHEHWGDRVTEIPPGELVSYKYHCRQGLPEGAKIATFHGEPNPHQVDDAWVRANWL